MTRLLLIAVLALIFTGCASSLTVCDQALKARKEANRAPLEQKATLDAKAAGLEDACARERAQSVQQQKDWNEQNRRR
jgi:PBP1b-binding outer membrane lipoprotein LpoB